MTVAMSTIQAAAQQEAYAVGKFTDNWQVGINGGVDALTTHTEIIYNLNPRAGVRIGRGITPVLGLALQGLMCFRNEPFPGSRSPIKASNVDLLATVNINNLVSGYLGEPRKFEVILLGGFGWGHLYGLKAPRNAEGDPEVLVAQMDKNAFMGKLAFDLALNLGAEREWQLYLEPSINYHLDADGNVQLNINRSSIALMAGINYKLPNSDGRRHAARGRLRNQEEIDRLNKQVNELRADLKAKEAQMARDARQLQDLKDRLDKLGDVKPSNFDLDE